MNNQIFLWFYGFAHQSAWLDNLIVFSAVYLPFLVGMIAGLYLLFHHEVFKIVNPVQVFLQKKKEILLVFFTASLAWICAVILKIFIATPRPVELLNNIQPLFLKLDNSFPSGHATFFFALAMAIYFTHKKAGYIFMILALIICVARIVGGVHFPVDILGGIVLGKVVAWGIYQLSVKFAYSRGKM